MRTRKQVDLHVRERRKLEEVNLPAWFDADHVGREDVRAQSRFPKRQRVDELLRRTLIAPSCLDILRIESPAMSVNPGDAMEPTIHCPDGRFKMPVK